MQRSALVSGLRRPWSLPPGLPAVVWGLATLLALGAPRGAVDQRASRPLVVVERRAFLMGTELVARVAAPTRATGVGAIEAAFRAVRHVDAVLSTWRQGTELARVNALPPHAPIGLSEDLWVWLMSAWAWREATAGAFDPYVGALIDAWDLRGRGRVPEPMSLAHARTLDRGRLAVLDSARRVVAWDGPHGWLDAGAFGKGAALAEADRVLRRAGVRSAYLNFGGQVLALGGAEGGADWTAGIADPRDRARAVASLAVRDASVATTSQSERFVAVGGVRYGHVLDPRTGRPVPAWGSVTVVAADPLSADALSTALFVLGPEAGFAWADEHGVAAVFAVVDGRGVRVRWTPAAGAALVDVKDP